MTAKNLISLFVYTDFSQHLPQKDVYDFKIGPYSG